jgi:hypothetical protein
VLTPGAYVKAFERYVVGRLSVNAELPATGVVPVWLIGGIVAADARGATATVAANVTHATISPTAVFNDSALNRMCET